MIGIYPNNHRDAAARNGWFIVNQGEKAELNFGTVRARGMK